MTDQMDELLTRAGAQWRDSLDRDPDLASMLPRASTPRRRPVLLAAVAAAVMVLGGAATAVALTHGGSTPPPVAARTPSPAPPTAVATASPQPTKSHRPPAQTGGEVGGGSSASCAAPTLTAQPKPAGTTSLGGVRRGATVTVYGWFFLTDCYDTGQQGAPPPVAHVTLYLQHGGARTVLGVARPRGDLGRFTARVTIPADAPLGRATLRERNPDLPASGALTLRVLPQAG